MKMTDIKLLAAFCSMTAFMNSSVQSIIPECEKCGCCENLKCKKGGHCLHGCQEGYWGDKCYNKCPTPCTSCGRNLVMVNGTLKHECYECLDGWYPGYDYDCSYQCQTNCKSCLTPDYCTECVPQFHNSLRVTNCSLTCPENCWECSSSQNCTSCIAGYFDGESLCMRKCPTNCQSCTELDLCDSCQTGYYNGRFKDDKNVFPFLDCRHRCRATCTECTSYNNCQQCKTGWYGSQCQFNCNSGCMNRTCDIISGKCNCRTGFIGDHCEECETGRFGTDCNDSCPHNCHGNKCERKTGSCFRCVSNDFIGAECNQCAHDKHGDNCLENCPSTCIHKSGIRTCDVTFGYCVLGCKDGYHGSTCNNTCNEFCIDDLCDQEHGSCVKGCKASGGKFKDVHCTVVEDDRSLIQVVAPTVGGVVILIIGVVADICFIRYRRRRRQRIEDCIQSVHSNPACDNSSEHQYVEMEQLSAPDHHLYEGLSDEIPESGSSSLPDYVNTKLTVL